jgi:hypothetical protein
MNFHRNHALAAAVAITLLLLPAVTVTAQAAGRPCSEATLRGNYAFTVDGQIFPPNAPARTLRGVAMARFDGKGGFTQVDHATLNGVPMWSGWRPATGTYALNSDCTGTGSILPSDGSPAIQLHMVVFDNGQQIRTIVDGNAVTSAGSRVN